MAAIENNIRSHSNTLHSFATNDQLTTPNDSCWATCLHNTQQRRHPFTTLLPHSVTTLHILYLATYTCIYLLWKHFIQSSFIQILFCTESFVHMSISESWRHTPNIKRPNQSRQRSWVIPPHIASFLRQWSQVLKLCSVGLHLTIGFVTIVDVAMEIPLRGPKHEKFFHSLELFKQAQYIVQY